MPSQYSIYKNFKFMVMSGLFYVTFYDIFSDPSMTYNSIITIYGSLSIFSFIA